MSDAVSDSSDGSPVFRQRSLDVGDFVQYDADDAKSGNSPSKSGVNRGNFQIHLPGGDSQFSFLNFEEDFDLSTAAFDIRYEDTRSAFSTLRKGLNQDRSAMNTARSLSDRSNFNSLVNPPDLHIFGDEDSGISARVNYIDGAAHDSETESVGAGESSPTDSAAAPQQLRPPPKRYQPSPLPAIASTPDLFVNYNATGQSSPPPSIVSTQQARVGPADSNFNTALSAMSHLSMSTSGSHSPFSTSTASSNSSSVPPLTLHGDASPNVSRNTPVNSQNSSMHNTASSAIVEADIARHFKPMSVANSNVPSGAKTPAFSPAVSEVKSQGEVHDVTAEMDGYVVDRWGQLVKGDVADAKRRSRSSQDVAKKEKSRETKWLQMLQEWDKFNTKQIDVLRKRVYKGIPDSLRAKVWWLLARCDFRRRDKLFEWCLSQDSPHASTIHRDIKRTFPNHVMFHSKNESDYAPGHQALFDVLKAYSIYDSDLGYCQGLGFPAALFLMYFTDEDAFWMLESVLNQPLYNLKDLYTENFPLLRQYFYVLQYLLQTHCPKLFAHFYKLGIKPELYATRWFMTIWTASMPFDIAVRVWDILLFEGPTIFFRLVIHILKSHERDLLKIKEFPDVCMYFRKMDESLYDIDPEELFKQMAKSAITHEHVAALSYRFRQCVWSDIRIMYGCVDGSLYSCSTSNFHVDSSIKGPTPFPEIPSNDNHTARVTALCFLRDGYVVTASHDGTLHIWHLLSGNCHLILKAHNEPVLAVLLHPSGRLVSCSSENLKVWAVPKGDGAEWDNLCTITAEKPMTCFAMSAEGVVYCSFGNSTIGACHIEQKSIETVIAERAGCRITSLHVAPTLLLAGMEDGSVHVHQLFDYAPLVTLQGEHSPVTAVTTIGNKHLVSGYKDGVMVVWSSLNNKDQKKLKGHKASVSSLCPLFDGRLVSGAEDGKVKVWDVESATPVTTFKLKKTPVTATAIVPATRQRLSELASIVRNAWPGFVPRRASSLVAEYLCDVTIEERAKSKKERKTD